MTNKPLVSVVIPTYNCEQFIKKAIMSVKMQTYKNLEIIVVDDGSCDETQQVVSELVDGTVRYIYQHNQGVAQSRNTGILAASGEFIAYVDADDELDERMIEFCYAAIADENSEWCVTDILKVKISDGVQSELAEKSPVPSSNLVYKILEDDFVLRAPFFRRQTLIDLGLYDIRLKTREDWDMSIRLIRAGRKFSYIPKPLYKYYFRQNSLMRKSKLLSYNCSFLVMQKHHKEMAAKGDLRARKIYANNMWWLGRNYLLLEHELKHFLYCIFESIKYDFNIKRLINPLRTMISNNNIDQSH